MKILFSNLCKLLIVLAVILGMAGGIAHHAHAATDKHHHEDSCELCAVFHACSSTLIHTPTVLASIATVLISAIRIEYVSEQFKGFNLTLLHPGLDPPL